MQCSEAKCTNPAIAQYREGEQTVLLCTDCAIRYVRVADVKGLLLSIDSVDRRSVLEPPPESAESGEPIPMVPPLPVAPIVPEVVEGEPSKRRS